MSPARSGSLRLPELAALGLGNCASLPGVPPTDRPRAAFGVCEPRSAGKDSTTGHWEICGLVLEHPFPTYPRGFPAEVIAEFSRLTGRGVLGNKAASGTAVLDEFGEEHQRSGRWIVYTSADSVFQVAAHESTVPLAELYAACAAARELLRGEHGVSRVIARPFTGAPGAWVRTRGAQGLQPRASGRHSARPAGRSTHSRGWASARWTICSPVAASPASTRRPTARRTC